MKDVVIYISDKTEVYINQCHNPGKKTKFYTVRKNDKTGLAHLLAVIKWDGGWWQYTFQPEPNTKWSIGCLKGIENFLAKINKKRWYKK